MGNVYSIVQAPSDSFRRTLDRAFAIEIQNRQFAAQYSTWAKYDGRKHFYSTKTDAIPTGLLHILDKQLKNSGYEPIYVDKRVKPQLTISKVDLENPILGEGSHKIQLRDYQIEAINIALQNSRGIINMAVRSGKTEIMASICENIQPTKECKGRVCILYNNVQLLRQTANRIEQYLGEKVGMIFGGSWTEERITCVGVQKFYKDFTSKNKMVKERAKKFLKSMDILLVDECHRLQAKTWYTIAANCPAYYRYGFSGTPYSNNMLQSYSIVSMLGRTLYTIGSKELSDQGYTAEASFIIINNPAKPPELKSYMQYEQHVQYGIIENYFRNNIIKNLAKKYSATDKVLIIVDRIEHGETLSQELDCDFVWGNHSIDYRERIFKEFDQGDKQLLIANKIMGEGINIKNIKYLIYAAGYKAYTRIIQHSGRALTKKEYGENNAVIIDFADTFSKYLSEHSEERINIYKGTGYQVLYEDPYEYLDDSLLDLYKEHSRLKKDRFIQNVDTSINDIENKLSKLLNSDNRV